MSSEFPFAHLHVHSEYSLLDGACRFDKLVEHVQKLGMNSVALTDHGNLFGVVPFVKSCRAGGVKPIIGCEMYVAPHGRFDKIKKIGEKSAAHLLLLAKDYEGYLNLCRLSSIGYLEGFYSKPRIDHEVLARHSKGLIATSSCLAGQIPQAIINDRHDEAKRLLGEYLDIFGPENFFLEVQDHGITEQKKLLKTLMEWNKALRIPLLATNDCHYTEKEDAEVHDLLLCIQTKATVDEPNRFRFHGPHFYVKSPQEMYQLFGELQDACLNTVRVAEMCNADVPLGQRLLPKYPTPNEMTDEDYLRRLTLEGMERRYPSESQEVRDRVDLELGVINRMGFASYFLIVWDFIDYARRNEISVGPGRGSAAGSVVAYCLQITDVDPIEHHLLFERFLNPERVSMPDIDVDFCFENRGRVIEYVKQKYGQGRVAQIITFGTQKPKNAIKDVGRALNVPNAEVNKLVGLIPPIIKTEGKEKPFDALMRGIPEFRQAYETDPTCRRLIDISRKMEGQTRHASTHAAGIIISDRDLIDLVPLYKPSGTEDIAIQFTMGIAEEVGLLKMDFLGLKNLTIIDNTIRWVERNHGVVVNWDTISLDDTETYEFVSEGNTFGIFQLESSGITEVVKRLRPSSFADMTALLAVYRPGPIESGMVDDFVERKNGRREIRYDHPLLEPILRETYGTILYQEQVMQIAQILAGYTLGEADLMRRAMGKKKKEEMDKQRQKFIEGASTNGIDPTLAESIFNYIDKFAGYGFNKSHSAAYAVVAFRTAYLKAKYPVEYTAALMTNAIGGKVEDMATFFADARKLGIKVLQPHVNESQSEFTPLPGRKIRFGLTAIKGVGEGVVQAILAERTKHGPFKSFENFCKRVSSSVLNSRVVESLIKVGSFEGLGKSRARLLSVQEEIVSVAMTLAQMRAAGQEMLFGDLDEDTNQSYPRAALNEVNLALDEVTDEVRFAWEKELLGHYVTGSPLDAYQADIEQLSSHSLADLEQLDDNSTVRVVAEITGVTIRPDRSGNNMAWLTVTDLATTTELMLFSRNFEANRQHLVKGATCLFAGTMSRRREEARLMVSRITPVLDARAKSVEGLDVQITGSAVRDRLLSRILDLLRKFPGRTPVTVTVIRPGLSISIPLQKNCRVSLDNDLLKALQRLLGLSRLRYVLTRDEID
jgi:DNA polymerase-3 subunit alpha